MSWQSMVSVKPKAVVNFNKLTDEDFLQNFSHSKIRMCRCRDRKEHYIEGNEVPDIICDKEKNYDISPAI